MGTTIRPHYGRWRAMIQRCKNPGHQKFPLYGGRGITVCDEWHDFWVYAAAVEALGPKPSDQHTIDRIDNDGNYEPGNIKWSSHSEQLKNRREYKHTKPQSERKPRGNMKTLVTAGGKPVTTLHAAELLGCRVDTLKERLQRWRKARPGLTCVTIEELSRKR
jgi:hypothetical protein